MSDYRLNQDIQLSLVNRHHVLPTVLPKPLNGITLGRRQTNNINKNDNINQHVLWLTDCVKQALDISDKNDHIN